MQTTRPRDRGRWTYMFTHAKVLNFWGVIHKRIKITCQHSSFPNFIFFLSTIFNESPLCQHKRIKLSLRKSISGGSSFFSLYLTQLHKLFNCIPICKVTVHYTAMLIAAFRSIRVYIETLRRGIDVMILWWDTPYRIKLFQSNRSIGANISKIQ